VVRGISLEEKENKKKKERDKKPNKKEQVLTSFQDQDFFKAAGHNTPTISQRLCSSLIRLPLLPASHSEYTHRVM
jgi:hypothetical protein